MIVRSSFRNSSSETVRASRRAREHARLCLLILDRTPFPERDQFHYRIQWSILRYDEAPAIAPVGRWGHDDGQARSGIFYRSVRVIGLWKGLVHGGTKP